MIKFKKIIFILFIILIIYILLNSISNKEKFSYDLSNNLFWQYPVISEKTFYLQNKNNKKYLAIPWATIIDKNIDLKKINQKEMKNKSFTCCQHIYFRKLIKFLRKHNITTLYTPHKIINEDYINGILIKPCPLYAVNFENKNKNKMFQNIDFINYKRNLLYSFIGGYQKDYITDIRLQIFKMEHPKNTLIKNTGEWFFNKIVYNEKQNKKGQLNENKNDKDNTNFYNKTLINSRYSLCPSGTGPNSIRFWESLAVGSIPILLSDTLDLPKNKLWKDTILRIKETDLKKIPEILNRISIDKEKEMRQNCLKIYNQYRNNYTLDQS